jgi:hypothetical protein
MPRISRTPLTLAKRQKALLVSGLLLLCLGVGLILTTTRLLPIVRSAAYTGLTVAGVILSLLAFWKEARAFWSFLGYSLILSGFFLLIVGAAAPSVPLRRIWPFFMVFAGLSIIAAGYMKTHRVKASYLIPSACFVLLGTFFLLFSLGIVSLSLKEFILRLWPALLIAGGGVITALYIGNRIHFSRRDDADGEE